MVVISLKDLNYCFEVLDFKVSVSQTEDNITVSHPKTLDSSKKVGLTFKKNSSSKGNFTWELITPIKLISSYFG